MCEVLSQQSYDEEKCIVCGYTVRFYENEYKKPCDHCGTWVFEKKQIRQQELDRNKEPKCWICMDQGIVEYPLQQGMGVYTYVARCICPKGMNWPSTIPILEQCQHVPKTEFLEYRNMQLYKKVWDGTQ